MPVKPCLLCRQSQEIKDEVLRMARDNYRYPEILAWLETEDIHASYTQLTYFIHISGAQKRFKSIPAPDDYADKVRIYITRLLRMNGKTYNIKNLRLSSGGWTPVTMKLHKEGLIEAMGGNPRTRWRLLASKEELEAWMHKELAENTTKGA